MIPSSQVPKPKSESTASRSIGETESDMSSSPASPTEFATFVCKKTKVMVCSHECKCVLSRIINFNQNIEFNKDSSCFCKDSSL